MTAGLRTVDSNVPTTELEIRLVNERSALALKLGRAEQEIERLNKKVGRLEEYAKMYEGLCK
jgi:hypothetical protein